MKIKWRAKKNIVRDSVRDPVLVVWERLFNRHLDVPWDLSCKQSWTPHTKTRTYALEIVWQVILVYESKRRQPSITYLKWCYLCSTKTSFVVTLVLTCSERPSIGDEYSSCIYRRRLYMSPRSPPLSCFVSPTGSWRQAVVKFHVNWQNWRNYGNHNSLDIGPIHFKFCAPASSPQDAQVCVTFRNDFNFSPINFQSAKNWRNPLYIWAGKCRVSQKVWRKTTYRTCIPLHLSNWPMKNYSLARFM